MNHSSVQEHELLFWNALDTNTLVEDNKQVRIYAPRLKFDVDLWMKVDFEGKSVLDIGSGPTSMLLKGKNLGPATAVDPLMNRFPQWVRDRYLHAEIEPVENTGEEYIPERPHDIVLVYNVMQHIIDIEKFAENIKKMGKEVRIFEWVNVPADEKHPHVLTPKLLNELFGTKGIVEHVRELNCFTDAWYSVVKL